MSGSAHEWCGKTLKRLTKYSLGLVVFAMLVLIPTALVLAVQEMTPERAAYIYNVCTGRFLISDIIVSRYCSGITSCLDYRTPKDCYYDLKNGETIDTE